MDELRLKQLMNTLPKTPDIHGKDEYIYSAVLVLLTFINGEYHFVFEKRSSRIRQGGEICFPGGKYEPKLDSSTKDTVIRETVEEIGLAKKEINIIGKLDTQVAPMGALVEAFIGITNIINVDEMKIDSNEVAYVFTVPVSYFEKNEPEKYYALLRAHPSYIDENGNEIVTFPAKEMGLPENYTKPWGDKKHNIYVYKINNEIIWGITARFIYDIVKMLRGIKK